MMKKNAKELLEGYKHGTLTPQEKLLVEHWFMKHDVNENFPIDEDRINYVKAQIWEVVDARRIKSKTVKLWPRIAAVAAVLLVFISAGLLFLVKTNRTEKLSKTYSLNDFAPGKNKATLLLGNGKLITLSDIKTGVAVNASALIYNDGTHVASDTTTPINYNHIVANTPRGGTYQLILPDGTRVWLNSATQLSFPTSFAKLNNRTVELKGEAYFEVTKDAAHPFIVVTGRQQIQVLGTHFNVNAYADEDHEKTVLLEGSVRINNKKTLSPGQQSRMGADGNIRIEVADIDEAMAWKNGYFSFKDAPLDVILRQLSRWYNIDIIYNGEIKDDTFNGLINRKSNLSRALKILEEGGVHFHLQGKILIVTP